MRLIELMAPIPHDKVQPVSHFGRGSTMGIDYAKWIADAIRADYKLSKGGLAEHLQRDASTVTMLVQGRRELSASEIDAVEDYLGVIRPSRLWVPVVGTIGDVWRSAPQHRRDDDVVAPVLSRWKEQQIAFRIVDSASGYPIGSVVIAVPLRRDRRVAGNKTVVLKRTNDGLENFSLAPGDAVDGQHVGVVIEVRIPL